MTEFTPENGQAETLLTEAFAWLKDLHHRDNGDQSDALRSTERIITLLGSTTRELLEVFEQNIRLAAIVDKKEMPSQEAITAMVRERALKIIYHHYEYSGQNPIKSLKYGSFLTEQYLEECVRDGGGEKSLHSFGLVMLDVDGLKAVKECIGHKGTNIFLKKLTKVLTDPESPTNVWMRETEGLEITPIVAGGDEFVLIINSAKPIDAVLMQEIIDRYESDVTSSAELQAMIDFDDPVILLNYAGKSRAERQAIRLLPENEQQAIFAEIRQHLPGKFIPSVTGGGATLAEGVMLAAEHNDTRSLMETSDRFTDAAQEIFDEVFLIAEIRQSKRKTESRDRYWNRTLFTDNFSSGRRRQSGLPRNYRSKNESWKSCRRNCETNGTFMCNCWPRYRNKTRSSQDCYRSRARNQHSSPRFQFSMALNVFP